MFHRATIYERASEYELIENVEQVKLKNQKQSDIKVSLDLKIYFIYTVYSYSVKKILHLNFCCIFLPPKSKTIQWTPGYSGQFIAIEWIKPVFLLEKSVFLLEKKFRNTWKTQHSFFVESYCMLEYKFSMTVTRNKSTTQKTSFF